MTNLPKDQSVTSVPLLDVCRGNRPLKEEIMASIAEIQLGYLKNLLKDRRIELEISKEALGWLAHKGYDPVYGARPLKRVIQRQLQDPLASLLLEGQILDGDCVQVNLAEDKLDIRAANHLDAAAA